MDVDAILQSMDEEHDDDVDDLFPSDKEDELMIADAMLTDSMGATTSVDHDKTSRGRSQPDQSSSSLSHATKLNKTKRMNPSNITKQKTQQQSSSSSNSSSSIITNRLSSSSITNMTSTTTSSTSPGGMTTIEESITSAALSRAETYERRLLRPSTRDIVSPLMVKRRMKPKIELQTRIRKAHTEKEMTLEHSTPITNTNTNTNTNTYVHERQKWQLCAVHTINNLLQLSQPPPKSDSSTTPPPPVAVATKAEFDQIANELTMMENALLKDGGGGGISNADGIVAWEVLWSHHRTPFLGNYSFEVIESALKNRDVQLKWYDPNDYEQNNNDTLTSCSTIGFIVNRKATKNAILRTILPRNSGRHWFAITKIATTGVHNNNITIVEDEVLDGHKCDNEQQQQQQPSSSSWVVLDSEQNNAIIFDTKAELIKFLKDVKDNGGSVFAATRLSVS